jgi:hypothetical protein
MDIAWQSSQHPKIPVFGGKKAIWLVTVTITITIHCEASRVIRKLVTQSCKLQGKLQAPRGTAWR